MRSIIKISVALLLALVMLCGCTPADSNTDDTTPADNDDSAIHTPLDLTLYDATTSYTVVRAEWTETDIITLAANFRNSLNELTDVTVKISDDWLMRDTQPDPNALEILVSNTNRPESDRVLDSLGYHDYAIKVVGKKVVIAAHNMDTLSAAIDYALQNLIKVADDGSVKLIGEYTYKSDIADIISNYDDLAEYKLVVPTQDANARELAQTLQAAIKKACGAELKIAGDHVSEVEKEILIGATTRTESDTLSGLKGLEYILCVNGNKIVMGGNTKIATSKAIDAFINNFLSTTFSDTLKVPSDYDNSQIGIKILDGAEDPTLAEGADLRIMSFNILSELWDDKAKATMPGRDEHVIAILLSYMPDVVGLQETTALWYSLLESQLEGIYKFASYKTPSGKTNYSTLMYNVNTTEFIEGGTTVFQVGNSENMRNLTWGRFRRISDGAEYIVTCTHWDITDERRQAQWPENAQLINDLYAKYKLPIFATGDYNSNEQDLFAKFLAETKMIDPRYSAKVVNNAGKTTHTLSEESTASGLCIDHIACTPVPELLYYNVLRCKTAIDASDHCPVYIDVKLK